MKPDKNRLLILTDRPSEYANYVERAGLKNLEVFQAKNASAVTPPLTACNIVLGDPPVVCQVIDRLTALEWVQSSWAGVDSFCQPGVPANYRLTGVKDIFGPSISEYIMTYLFAFERQVFQMRSHQLNQTWRPLRYRSAGEITIGVLGLGSIGRHLAATARHFGMRVVGLNRSGLACEGVERVYTATDRHLFFAESDYIVITLPATPLTRHFINRDSFAMMKPSAVLMNVGRGSVVNERDLVDALEQRKIAGAVLDVFEKEPLPLESPLWRMENVFITPHNAAISFAKDVVAIFLTNYQRFIRGKTLLHEIDIAAGY